MDKLIVNVQYTDETWEDVELNHDTKAISHEMCCRNYDVLSIIIPEGIIEIADNGFEGFGWLTNLTLPSTPQKIGEGAFEYNHINSLKIPGNVIEIDTFAFYGCDNLKTVKIENGLTKLGKAPDFCPERLIDKLGTNAINHRLEYVRKYYKQFIDIVRSYPNPVEPPQYMKLFSGALEEVSDMRYFLYNKGAAIGIIYIDPNMDTFCLNQDQMSLYEYDTTISGSVPYFPGLYHASYIDDMPDVHEWKSVTNEIMENLSKILYWIKFSELTGISPDMSNLNGPMKRMYDMIMNHKDEFMKDYNMIAFDGE